MHLLRLGRAKSQIPSSESSAVRKLESFRSASAARIRRGVFRKNHAVANPPASADTAATAPTAIQEDDGSATELSCDLESFESKEVDCPPMIVPLFIVFCINSSSLSFSGTFSKPIFRIEFLLAGQWEDIFPVQNLVKKSRIFSNFVFAFTPIYGMVYIFRCEGVVS
jgi:hypothetical protein